MSARAAELFRERFGMDERALDAALGTALARPLDHAELFFEYSTQETLALEDSLVTRGEHHLQQGVGVRAICGERQGYAHTGDITLRNLQNAAGAARAISEASGGVRATEIGMRDGADTDGNTRAVTGVNTGTGDGTDGDGDRARRTGVGDDGVTGINAGTGTDGNARAVTDANTDADGVRTRNSTQPMHALYPLARDELATPVPDRVAALDAMDRYARARDPRVVQVMASIHSEERHLLIAASDGTWASDIQPLVRINVQVIVQGKEGRRETGYHGFGGRRALAPLLARESWQPAVDEALRIALLNLDAAPCPAGAMDVVLGPGWPGVLLHEAVGHGLEGDFNRRGTSAFSGRIGERVAAPGVTVVDDGTLPARRGSLNVDDEGTPTARTCLIEDGILRGYLHDRLNARLLGHAPTGNGRRESYAHRPMPRMTNTFMLAGSDAPEDLLRGVQNGLYAVNFGGGQVDITNGKFVFECTEAYRIEGGRIGAPVRGATLIGNGPDVLTRVAGIGHDLQLDTGVGTCGKDGQGVPVGVGQPTLHIRELIVGGTG